MSATTTPTLPTRTSVEWSQPPSYKENESEIQIQNEIETRTPSVQFVQPDPLYEQMNVEIAPNSETNWRVSAAIVSGWITFFILVILGGVYEYNHTHDYERET